MFDFNKVKKIKVTRTIPFDREDVFPLKPGVKYVPNWYKKSPHTADFSKKHFNYDGTEKTFPEPDVERQIGATYKRCLPMFDAMTIGYMYGLLEDVTFDEKTQTFSFTPVIQQTTHSPYESEGYVFPEDAHTKLFKWNSDRIVEFPPGYMGLIITPLHRNDLPFYTLAGIVDLDRHPLPVNPPFIMKKGFSGIIKKGTPLWQLIPIKKDHWEIEHQGDSPLDPEMVDAFFEMNSLYIPKTGVYKHKVREKKEYY